MQKNILKAFKVKTQQKLTKLQDVYLRQPCGSIKMTKKRNQITKTALICFKLLSECVSKKNRFKKLTMH